MDIASATLVLGIINIVVVIRGFYITNNLSQKRDAHMEKIKEITELNKKIHDRLVESNNNIKNQARIPKEINNSLFKCAARISKYDDSISSEIYRLLNTCELAISMWEYDHDPKNLLSERGKCQKYMRYIENKIDKLFNDL